MKVLLLLCFCVAVAYAAEVQVISQETQLDSDGKYYYHYELDDGSKAIQMGALKHVNAEHDGEAIEGQFAFVADDGKQYELSYTADENGYRPVGAHLPTPPPTPESVLKTLKYLAEHPPYQPPAEKIKKF